MKIKTTHTMYFKLLRQSFLKGLFLMMCFSLMLIETASGQNVGIGTTSPLQKLHVEGTAYIKDSLGIGTTTPTNKLSVQGSANFTGNVGIGTNTPISKLTLNGLASDYVQGPHWAALMIGDPRPVFQQLNWAHDNIGLQFDSYYTGTNWLSSSNTNNFQIYKLGGKLQFNYATNITAGNAITWQTGLTLDGSGKVGISTATPTNKLSVSGNADFTGNVGIGTTSPSAKLHISGSGLTNQIQMDDVLGATTRINANYGVSGPYPYIGTTSNHPFGIVTNNAYRIFIDGTGNVGIGNGTSSPAASAQLDVSSTTKGFLPPRMTSAQRDAITPAEGLMIYNTTSKKPNFYNGTEWQNLDGSFFYVIGDNYLGGKIAYILQPGDPGYIAGQTHGLIAAAADQSAAVWGCYLTDISGADGTALGTGNQNTIDIMAGCATTGIAARICGDLELNGFSDWYLPSKDELNKLYVNRIAIGGFAVGFYAYWSSSEIDISYAWAQYFNDGSPYNVYKFATAPLVRAVRAF